MTAGMVKGVEQKFMKERDIRGNMGRKINIEHGERLNWASHEYLKKLKIESPIWANLGSSHTAASQE